MRNIFSNALRPSPNLKNSVLQSRASQLLRPLHRSRSRPQHRNHQQSPLSRKGAVALFIAPINAVIYGTAGATIGWILSGLVAQFRSVVEAKTTPLTCWPEMFGKPTDQELAEQYVEITI